MKPITTFLEAAEEDYKGFLALVEAGCNNAAAHIAARACEKYAKHILCEFREIKPSACQELTWFNQRTKKREKIGHSADRALKAIFVESHKTITAPQAVRDLVKEISPLNMTASYPDVDGAHFVEDEEILRCVEAIKSMRVWCYEKLSELETDRAMTKGDDEINEME